MNVWRRRAFKGAKGGFFMELEMYRRYSQMARGIEKAELVFKNGRVFSSDPGYNQFHPYRIHLQTHEDLQ